MKVLLYEQLQLNERRWKGCRIWKACHISAYLLAAGCGVINYYFLIKTMGLFGDNCVLFPKELAFKDVVKNRTSIADPQNFTNETRDQDLLFNSSMDMSSVNDDATEDLSVLHIERSFFKKHSYCDLSLYAPVLSVVFGLVWCALFIVYPAGGFTRTGIKKPWKLLFPALLFSLTFAVFSAVTFVKTNGGLQALCAAFEPVTNATTCSQIDAHLETGNNTWSAFLVISLTRGGAGGVWASWACAATLLISRCLSAPDFKVARTSIYFQDPGKQINNPSSTHPRISSNQNVIRKPTSPKPNTGIVTARVEHPTFTHEVKGEILNSLDRSRNIEDNNTNTLIELHSKQI